MSEVLSIRIPKALKREIEELKGVVDWRKEIIGFLEQRVRYYQKLMVIEQVNEILERHPILPKGAAVRVVREDRDSY